MLDQAVGLTFVKQNTNLQDAMILLIGHIFGKQPGKAKVRSICQNLALKMKPECIIENHKNKKFTLT